MFLNEWLSISSNVDFLYRCIILVMCIMIWFIKGDVE